MATGTDEKEMKRQGGALQADAVNLIRTSSASDSPMKLLGGLLKGALGLFLGVAGAAHGKVVDKKK